MIKLENLNDYLINKINTIKNLFINNTNMYSIISKNIKNSLQVSLIYLIFVLGLFQLINILLNYTYLILIIYNLISLLMSIICIISIFTWLNLIYGIHLNESKIYLIFLTCFISEFMIQFIKYNNFTSRNLYTNNFVSTSSNNSLTFQMEFNSNSNSIEVMIENAQHVVIISILCVLIFLYTNLNKRQYIYIILVICLTRFYGSIYLSKFIPNSTCSYFTYICALLGVLFSKYVEEYLASLNNKLKATNSTTNNNNNNTNIQLTNSNAILSNKKNSCNGFLNINTAYSNLNISKSSNTSTNNLSKTRRKLTGGSSSSGSNSTLVFKRRTSLPTIPTKNNDKYSSSSTECLLAKEIKSIADEALGHSGHDLSITNLINALKSIQNLILQSNSITNNRFNFLKSNNKLSNGYTHSPSTSKTLQYSSSKMHDNVANDNDEAGETGPELNSYSADEDEECKYPTLVYLNDSKSSTKHKLRKSLPAQFYKRMSQLTWSTTTSANGLPVVEACPSRQRSLSLKGPTFTPHLPHSLPAQTYHKSNECVCQANDGIKVRQEEAHDEFLSKQTDENRNSYDDEDEDNAIMSSNIASNQNRTSDYDSGESPNSSDYNSDTDKLQLKVIFSFFYENWVLKNYFYELFKKMIKI